MPRVGLRFPAHGREHEDGVVQCVQGTPGVSLTQVRHTRDLQNLEPGWLQHTRYQLLHGRLPRGVGIEMQRLIWRLQPAKRAAFHKGAKGQHDSQQDLASARLSEAMDVGQQIQRAATAIEIVEACNDVPVLVTERRKISARS